MIAQDGAFSERSARRKNFRLGPALLLAVLGLGCASQLPPGPFYGDERFLVLGVDPEAEARAVADQLEQSGYTVTRTLRGRHFSALFAERQDTHIGKVRVVTVRGIALALDATAGDPLRPSVHYALLAPPSPESHDADGDGFEEVFVETAEGAGAPCILVYRVRDSGFVDLVEDGFGLPPRRGAEPPWHAPQFCEPEPAEAAEPQEQGEGAREPAQGTTAPARASE